MNKDIFTYQIQYQDVDADHRLRLYTLENHLLNSAGQAADARGFGFKYLYPQQLTWVLTTLSIELETLPTPGDDLTIETWVENNIHMLSIRNFRLSVNGHYIGQARSVWAVLHLTERSIQNVFHQPIFQTMGSGEKLTMTRSPHATSITEPDIKEQHKVVYSDIDYNGHCNSCKYLEIMMNTYQPTSNMFPLRLDLRYAKEIYKGDIVDVVCKHSNDAILYEIRTAAGELSCSARIAPLAQQP